MNNRVMRTFLLMLSFFLSSVTFAQIGYQVSLLDQATGAPRANEYVTVLVELTDNDGTIICSETKSATTNEFGIISLTIGDENTFATMDWSKLPLWISATVDGVIIGKSQVLNVPVAEYAKRTGELTKELLCSKTWTGHFYTYSFSLDGTYSLLDRGGDITFQGTYEIEGNIIYTYYNNKDCGYLMRYSPTRNSLFASGDYEYF